MIVLHLMPAPAWRAWMAGGAYEPASMATEGFVHCTAGDELMLGDCLWHVYGMIGKLSRRVYLLSTAG